MKPPHGTVHLWTAPLDLEEPALSSFERLLDPEEAARAHRFKLPHLRRRFIAAHGFVREVLSGYTGTTPELLQIIHSQSGKPELADPSGLRFSLSHSEGLAACAVADGTPVGVDVELIRDDVDIGGVARRFFTVAEYAYLAKLPEQARGRAFFRLWTRKEALIKGLGGTISELVQKVEVHGAGPALEAGQWTIVDLKMPAPYAGAVAVEARPLEVRYLPGS